MSLAQLVEAHIFRHRKVQNYVEIHAELVAAEVNQTLTPTQVRNTLQRLKMKGKCVTILIRDNYAYVTHPCNPYTNLRQSARKELLWGIPI